MTAVSLTKPPTPRPFRVTDIEALGRSFVSLRVVAGVIHNDPRSLADLFGYQQKA